MLEVDGPRVVLEEEERTIPEVTEMRTIPKEEEHNTIPTKTYDLDTQYPSGKR